MLNWIQLPIVVLVFAGWPVCFFVYFRLRKHWSFSAAAILSLALGYLAISLIAPIGLLAPPLIQNYGSAGKVLAASMMTLACSAPYMIMAAWALRARRKGRGLKLSAASNQGDAGESR